MLSANRAYYLSVLLSALFLHLFQTPTDLKVKMKWEAETNSEPPEQSNDSEENFSPPNLDKPKACSSQKNDGMPKLCKNSSRGTLESETKMRISARSFSRMIPTSIQ
eukprot:EG_transcript_30897